jgi:D-amino-acid dehydrogenase
MLQAAIARSAMLQGAMALFQDLIDKESLDCHWEARGVLYVFRSPQALQSHRDINTLLKSFGEGGQALNQRALQALEPTLRQDLAGGYLHEESAHLRPDFLMRELKRVLTSLGVRIQEQTTVTALQGQNGRVQEVATDRGSIAGDAFVVATGAWTPFLARELGCRIPIQPGKGYSATLPRPEPCPSRPCMLEEDRVVATPWPGGYRLGGTMEFTGYDDSLNPRRLKALYRGARRYFKPTQWAPVQEEWCGWRPMTFDGLPIIDRAPKWQNVMVAAGHNMLGISLAPGTGKLIAELLNGQPPHLDPKPYRIGRFTGLL